EDYQHMLDDEGRRLLGVVRSSTECMEKLIHDLLEFSRLGRQPLSMNVVDMREVTEKAWTEVSRSTSGRTPAITIDDLPLARGDSAMLHQVMLNLLSNAVKFTREAV